MTLVKIDQSLWKHKLMNFKDSIVKVNKRFLPDYDILGKSANKDRTKRPFKIRKDVFMSAVALGYLENSSISLPSGGAEDLFRTSVFTIEDTAILRALYLKKNKMQFNENYTDDNIIKQAMEWAEGGFVSLRQLTIADGDLSNLDCIGDKIKEVL